MKASNTQVGGNHYKNLKIQPYEFALANKLDYCQANVVKYVVRHASKNGLEDLKKAKHYIDLMIEHYYQDEQGVPEAILEAEKLRRSIDDTKLMMRVIDPSNPVREIQKRGE